MALRLSMEHASFVQLEHIRQLKVFVKVVRPTKLLTLPKPGAKTAALGIFLINKMDVWPALKALIKIGLDLLHATNVTDSSILLKEQLLPQIALDVLQELRISTLRSVRIAVLGFTLI